MKPLRAALFLRKSTDEQADSIETQRTNAEAWCATRAFEVVARHEERGVSRTEFSPEKRRVWHEMQAAARRRAFDVVVVRDPSRIGGNIGRALVFVEDLLATGVRLYCYNDGREITQANAVECVTLALQFFGAQSEVEAIRSRTREALMTKARAGRVAGGLTYGYKNREVPGPDGKRAYVERDVDPAEADVVRDLFERYARCEGLRTIARALNERGVPPPRASKTGRTSWSPLTIRSILRRELYRGRIVYGVTKKGYMGGTKVRTLRAPEELVVVDAPHLRIISEDLWVAVQAKMGAAPEGGPRVRKTVHGRPPVNLLSHILKCGTCGSPMRVVNTKVSHEREPAYMCSARQLRKRLPWFPEGCPNTLRRPVSEVNAVVLSWLSKELLREELVRDTLDEVRARIEARLQRQTDEAPRLEARAEKLRAECARMAELAMGAPKGVEVVFYEQIAERKTELDGIEAQLRATKAAPSAIDLEIRRMMVEAKTRIASMRDVLENAAPEVARDLLLKLFPNGIVADPIECQNPEGKGKRIRKRLVLSGESTAAWPLLLMSDEARAPSKLASPAGFEPA